MNRSTIRNLAVLLLLASPSVVRAHGDSTLFLASTASGGGALTADYEFESVSKLSFSASLGPISLYTGIFPGFEPITVDSPPLYALASGTQVSVVITGVDAGKTAVKFGSTVLDSVGDSVVIGTMPFGHTHPELQLQLQLPEGEFGEGRISFKLTASGPTTYAESEIYTLKISNGPLPLPDYDTAAYDSASVKCLSAASKAVRKFVGAEHKLLSKCLDKVQVLAAKQELTTPPPSLAAAEAAAEKACADASGNGPDSGTMLGKVAAARAKAFTSIQDACGAGGSNTLSDDDINQQLGLASCRTEELVSSTYGLAHAELEEINVRPSQGGDDVTAHFPCLFLTASD